jgi:superfamily II DNA or RNA helicase
LPAEYLINPSAAHTFTYVSTIRRMAINLFGREGAFPQSGSDPDYDEDAEKVDIPIHAFDLIIADECHRGYTAQETSIWREVLNHFDAVKIGLTATPAAHTVALFGDPVFRYGVEEAIKDGYLVDYEPVTIRSNVRLNGVFLRQGELKTGDASGFLPSVTSQSMGFLFKTRKRPRFYAVVRAHSYSKARRPWPEFSGFLEGLFLVLVDDCLVPKRASILVLSLALLNPLRSASK